MKKLIALLLCLALALSLVPAVMAESTVPDLAGTYYSYGYDIGMWMDYYFHFYDEVPGLGRVFYAGFALNQIVFTGTYEVIAEERAYACWPDRATLSAAAEGTPIPSGTAPYTVVFYDFDGNELGRCALDGEHLYNDMDGLSAQGGKNATYNLDTDPENSKFSAQYASEQAVTILSLISPDDDTATLDLKVNGKYDDLVVLYVEGTFSMNEDQTVITLTPDDEADDGATVTLNEDGTYTYVSESGDEVTLVENKGVEVAYAFKGLIPVPGMEGTNADLICNLYSDGSVKLYADFMGNAMDIDKGTYEMDMTTYALVMSFENAGVITSYGDGTNVLMDYAGNADPFGEIAQTLTFQNE